MNTSVPSGNSSPNLGQAEKPVVTPTKPPCRSEKVSQAQRLFDALRRISQYDEPARLRRRSFKDYGLDDANEAIEYAYENVLQEAKRAIKGMRRPV